MTEEEWLNGSDPDSMLEFVQGKASKRQLRLFATACCRRLTSHFKDERSLKMVEASERHADGAATADELDAAFDEAAEAQEAVHWEDGDAVDQSSAEAVLGLRAGLDFRQVFAGAAEAAGAVAGAKEWERIYGVPGRHWTETEREQKEVEEAGVRAECVAQTALLRDIFGNPFCPVAISPSWLTSTVVALAEGIYQDRAFDRMPILADALQDAGCDNDDVLNHCRSEGPHYCGCWVIDLLTGRK